MRVISTGSAEHSAVTCASDHVRRATDNRSVIGPRQCPANDMEERPGCDQVVKSASVLRDLVALSR